MKNITICATFVGLLLVSGVIVGCSGGDRSDENAEAVAKQNAKLPPSDPNFKPPVREDGGGGVPGKSKGP
jgi:hypothetical protein